MGILKLADRVKETSTTTGVGTYSLAGAASGFQTFLSGVASGNSCLYTAADGIDWECGIGTVTSGTPNTLSRDTILKSSNADAAVNWGVGSRDIWIDLPAERIGRVLLSDQLIASPVSSVDFTGLTGDYQRYEIEALDVALATNDAGLIGRVSIGGSFKSDGAYDNDYQANASGTVSGTLASSATSIVLSSALTNGGLYAINMLATLFKPAGTTYYKQVHFKTYSLSSGGTRFVTEGVGFYASASAVDGFRLMTNSGNINSGRFRLWGIP